MIRIELDPSLKHLTSGGPQNGLKLMEYINRQLEPWSQHLQEATGCPAHDLERITVRNFIYAALTGKFQFPGDPSAKEGDVRLPETD